MAFTAEARKMESWRAVVEEECNCAGDSWIGPYISAYGTQTYRGAKGARGGMEAESYILLAAL